MVAFCLLVFLKLITYIETTKPKSVNLALETVLEFNNKDNTADLKFIDNVQNVLDKVKTALGNDMTARRYDTGIKQIKFTEFVKSAIDVLKTYDDDDLEDVFGVFDDEIRKYHYRGCKFYELVENQSVRRFVANKLDFVKDKPARLLRKNLEKVSEAIENSKFSSGQTEFLDYINSLYRQDSSDKLRSFLNKLKTYRSKSKRANLDLIKVIKDGIRSIIFDHYSELNANARRDLKIKLETSWRDMKHPERINHKVWTLKYGLTNMDNYKTFNDNNGRSFTDSVKQKLVTHTMRTKNTKRDVSSEMSDTEGYETFYKPSSKKHKKIKEPRIQHHKKLSSFITLYPEEITLSSKKIRSKIESTTQKSKLYTLWEEKIKHKKRKHKKNEPSRPKSSKRIKADQPRIISDADMIINVKRAGMSLEDDASKMRQYSEFKTKNPYKWYKAKTTEVKHKKTTNVKFRKQFPVDNVPLSEEGMSIEEYEIKRRTMKTENNSEISAQNELKLNVLRRINDLEKQMAEVKNKIDTKLTTADDNNSLLRETELEPLEFWLGTTTSVNNTTFSTTLMTKSSTETNKNVTQLNASKTDITSKSNEVSQSGSKNIQNQDMHLKLNEISQIDSNKIQTTDTTSINNEIPQSDSNNNQNIDVTLKNNEIVHSPPVNIRTDENKTDNANTTKLDNIDITTEESKNISIPEDKNQHILANDFNEIGMDIEEDIDKVLTEFNLDVTTGPDGKVMPLDLHEYLKNPQPDEVPIDGATKTERIPP